MQCTTAAVACEVRAADIDWESAGGTTVLDKGAITTYRTSEEKPYPAWQLTDGSQHGGFAVNSPAEPYGSVVWPRLPGRSTHVGTAGGGVLWLRSDSGNCAVEAGGVVSSDLPTDALLEHTGYGSGGSVLIQCATVSGAGAIRVDGGGRTGTSSHSGAGGRVAVYADASTFTGQLSAWGGRNDVGKQAAPGTVFTKVTIRVVVCLVRAWHTLLTHMPVLHSTRQIGASTRVVIDNGGVVQPLAAGINEAIDELITTLIVKDAPLWLGSNARVRTLNLTGDASVEITAPQSLVVYSPICDAVAGGVTFTGQLSPLVLHLHDNQPDSGSFAAHTVITGDVNSAWSALWCRFGATVVHGVLAAGSDSCGGQTSVWTCAVPPKPTDVSVTEITVSVDSGATWHSFATPYMFKFAPTGEGLNTHTSLLANASLSHHAHQCPRQLPATCCHPRQSCRRAAPVACWAMESAMLPATLATAPQTTEIALHHPCTCGPRAAMPTRAPPRHQ